MSQNSAYLRLMLPVWARMTHPIFRQETQRQTYNRGLAILQMIFLPVLFAATGLGILAGLLLISPLLLPTSLDSVVNGALIIILLVLLPIQVGAGALGTVLVIAQTAPTISGEIELQSWRLLRSTTLPLHEIVLAKFVAALMQLRLMLSGLMILRIISTVTGALIFAYLLLRETVYNSGQADATLFFVEFRWLPLLLPLVTVTVAYLSQPVVQFLLNGALGMLASAYTRTRAQAIAGAFMGRLGLWALNALVHIAAYSGLTFLLTSWAQPQFAAIQSYRALSTPSPQAVTWVTCLIVSGYMVALVSGQIGLTLAGLGLVLRRARHLGV